MAEAVEESIHELEVEIIHFWVREREREKKKKTDLKLLLSFLGHIRNVNLLFKKNF